MRRGFFFLNNKQQLEYLLRIRKIREVMVVKDNIHLTYKYKNRNQAFKQVENLQDKIINHVIDDVLFGNVGELKNIEKTTSKIINDTLVNERKRIHRIDDRFVNHAVKSNTEMYSKFFNNRLNNIKYSLQLRIEEELRKNSIRNLSDSEIRKILSEKYADTGKARLKNIVKDSIHTNESNISFIQALNEGYSYKVWMNGRSKGKTRPWHRARIIASVPIDEYFDIYGSYHAELMYPGDLNGGAENVANCRCWLRYTNNRPSNLRRKGSSSRSNSKSTQNNSINTSNKKNIGSKVKERVSSTIARIQNKLKKEAKNVLSSNSSKSIKSNKEQMVLPIDEEELTRKIKKHIIGKDTELISELIITLSKRIPNRHKEYGAARFITGQVKRRFTSNNSKYIKIPKKIKKKGLEKGLHSLLHNHPFGESPLPSPEDIYVYMLYKVRFGISFNENGMVILRNKRPIANKRNAKKISREVSNIVMEIKLNYHTYNPNWCDLTKEEYYKSLNEYTIKNNEYFYKLYKQRLKKYGIDIIFIKL